MLSIIFGRQYDVYTTSKSNWAMSIGVSTIHGEVYGMLLSHWWGSMVSYEIMSGLL